MHGSWHSLIFLMINGSCISFLMFIDHNKTLVERKHQDLLNVALALYFQSQVPIHFWSECILTATILINRTPSPLTGNKTPHELLYLKQFDYTSLMLFRCVAFALTLSAQRTKFQPRARICFFFLGYLTVMKA